MDALRASVMEEKGQDGEHLKVLENHTIERPE